MEKSATKLGSINRFTFEMSSAVAAKRFRDYCYMNSLVMGRVLESLIEQYLVDVKDIPEIASLYVQQELEK